MIVQYFRKKIHEKQFFARQLWKHNNKKYISNIFNELNLEYKRYGNKNPNVFFYVIRRSPGSGFFSNLNFVIHNLLICDQLKMVPIIDMKNFITLYNCKVKINNSYNVWDYYFKPVSKFKLEEVYKSKNVIICDNRTSKKGFSTSNYKSNFKYFNGFQYLDKRHKKIIKKYIKFNKNILNESDKFVKKNFRNKNILGVCFRGSDQKKSAYHPHPPTEKQLLYTTNYLLKKYKFDNIYLCTEDYEFLNFFKKKYKSILLYNNSPRTTDKVDLFDCPSKKHRYYVGKGNVIDMLNLSKTNYMLFAPSNIPEAALYFSSRKIPHSIINNGMKGNIFISQFSYYFKKKIPEWLGGFREKNFTEKK
tara:strand:- start:427 stop:1509 length:1083 start_codon:yes stop_codon:yes gene_type:complete